MRGDSILPVGLGHARVEVVRADPRLGPGVLSAGGLGGLASHCSWADSDTIPKADTGHFTA